MHLALITMFFKTINKQLNNKEELETQGIPGCIHHVMMPGECTVDVGYKFCTGQVES